MSNREGTYSHARYIELDALRGIAALSVVLWHFFCATYTIADPIVKTPLLGLYFLVHGRSAVILFFILSGFVLSLPFFKQPQPGYVGFATRRICRIYLPYVVLVAGTILVRTFVTTRPLPGLSDWFNAYCGDPFSLRTALEHLNLVGNIHSDVYNNAVWSLIHEMRISLVFPLLFLFVVRVRPLVGIALGLSLSGIALMNELYGWEASNGWESGYFYSLHVASLFIMGILLAQHRNRLIQRYTSMSRATKITLLAVSLILYRFSMEVWLIDRGLLLISDYGTVVGACVLMVTALGSKKASSVLNRPSLGFLGNISYSLYLNQITMLYLAFFLLYDHLPVLAILPIYVVAAVLVSFVTWKVIERPSIALGRALS